MINKLKNIHLSLKLTGALVVVLAVSNLVGSNLLATRGHEVETLTIKAKTLQKENSYLSNQIAKFSSLSYIENQANTQGFQKINSPVALTTPAPVAYLSR